MRECGVVESVREKTAVVSVKRSTACGDSCATCSSKCNLKGNKITVSNTIGAEAGDLVMIEMKTSTVLKSAFLVYIFPLVLLFLAYFIAEYKFQSEEKGIICGMIAFCISFIILLIVDKINKNKFATSIIEIIEKRA